MSLWIQACLVDTEASTSEPTNSYRASVPSSPLCLPSHWERVPVCWEGLLFDYNPILYTRMQCFLPPPASRRPFPLLSHSKRTLRIKTNCLNQDYRMDRIIKNDKAAGTRMESLYPLLSQVWLTNDRQTGSGPGL